jgi:cytochrome c-type biogenesis protein CcmH
LKVVELTNGDADARADHAEALAMSDPAGLNGEAGDIFRELVKSAPGNPKVLWYGGLVAFESGDIEEGRRLWTQILELNPPDSLRQIVEQRLAETDTSDSQPMAPEPAPAMAQSAVAETEQEQPPANAGNAISVSISLSPQLTDRLAANMPLFVFARGAGGGPPLAVVRRSSAELPIAMTLSDDNAMMAGVSLSDHDTLQLVARVAMSGSPAAQPGDLFGEVSYSRSDGSSTTIVIDQVVP